MKPTKDNYPVFEANQVLSNVHLNNSFDYLDEQQRLTRANLIGIGIVCGLEIQFNGNSIKLSKGCGITSEGYLIVEPEDVDLIAYRKLDQKPSYDPFAEIQGDLYELFPKQASGTSSVSNNNFFQDKAVLLFLELKSDNLRNCSPNNCNDQGTVVTPTIRRLLISQDDLEKVIKNVNALETSLTSKDLERILLARLNLPDLRLPRYHLLPMTETNAVASEVVMDAITSEAVLTTFLLALQKDKVVKNVGNALRATYEAFKPLLQGVYEQNPFADSASKFSDKFGFLETVFASLKLEQVEKVKFLQYYYDFFDDLLRAYDEFRWKGVELMCSCCPDDGLFPRHLMLGVLFPDKVEQPSIYRHRFLSSSAVEGCKDRLQELVQLFQRMVEMVDQFTDAPLDPVNSSAEDFSDEQIRVTPSKLGDVPLSDKAIPYYYLKDNKPQLFEYWNVEKTRRHRSKQNLSYHAQGYANEGDEFVTKPLHYDLENYNFLRIEGHLGKDYRGVMYTLSSLKKRNQLPVEIIALCTGAFDAKIKPKISEEDCRFQDLESLYEVLKEKLICFLCKEVQYFYDLPMSTGRSGETVPTDSNNEDPAESVLPLLKYCAPGFESKPGTFGFLFEEWLKDVFAEQIRASGQSFEVWFRDKSGDVFSEGDLSDLLFVALGQVEQPIYAIIIHISRLFNQLTENLRLLDFERMEASFERLVSSIKECLIKVNLLLQNEEQTKLMSSGFLDWEELKGHLEAIVSNCHLAAFKGLYDEYLLRVQSIKKKRFLKDFLEDHPGIQHKAGVPLGGTFIVVYHNESGAGNREDTGLFKPGDVIADFYLPYLCCSDCSPIQYVLPKIPPIVSIQVDCAKPGVSTYQTVGLKIRGGIAPYYYRVCDARETECVLDQEKCFKPLADNYQLPSLVVGKYTIIVRDSMGAESVPQCITVTEPLVINDETFIDDWQGNTYQVKFEVLGGEEPYTASQTDQRESKLINKNEEEKYIYTSDPVESNKSITVTITDNAGCTVTSKKFKHTVCSLPCGGKAIRYGCLFWLPEPTNGRLLQSYSAEIEAFTLTIDGHRVEIKEQLAHCIESKDIAELNKHFAREVNNWLCNINKVVAKSIDGVNASLVTRLKRCAIRCFNQLKNAILRKEDCGTDWFRLAYRKASSNKCEALTIEHFDCEKFFDFKIVIRTCYQYHQDGVQQHQTVTYTPRVTHIDTENNICEIRSFDCENADKCTSDSWHSAGKPPIIQSIDVERGIVNCNEVTLTAQGEGIVQCLWECEDGSPSVITGNPVTIEFTHLLNTTKCVRCIAISESGDSSTAETIIEVK